MNEHVKTDAADVRLLEGEPRFDDTADDYAAHRHGFPEEFFARLAAKGLLKAGAVALDVGTGTGTVARGLARRGLRVYGLDPAAAMIEKARELCDTEGLSIEFRIGRAEETGMQDGQLDLVTAGQCWHWFLHALAIKEIVRITKPAAQLIIAHFDWIPYQGGVAALSEDLIARHNSAWKGGGGTGFYPAWAMQLGEAGFGEIETSTFDVDCNYTHAGWRGRIRASAGVQGSLCASEVARFDAEHGRQLSVAFPEPQLCIPHRCFTLTARLPSSAR